MDTPSVSTCMVERNTHKPKSVIRVYLKQIAIIVHNFITFFLTHKATIVAQIMVITIIRF